MNNKKTIQKLWVIEQYRNRKCNKSSTYTGAGMTIVTDAYKGKDGVVLHFPNIFTRRSDARDYLKFLKTASVEKNPSLENVSWKICSFSRNQKR